MQRMLDKQLVTDDFSRDLGLDNDKKQGVDPRTKMTLRHAQVCISENGARVVICVIRRYMNK